MARAGGVEPHIRVSPGAIGAAAFLLGAGAYGVMVGRSAAEAQDAGEMTAFFGAMQALLILGVSVIFLLVVGTIVLIVGREGRWAAIGTIYGMAGGVVLGFFLGDATWPATQTSQPYSGPVLHHAQGTADLRLEASEWPFTARPSASVRCDSIADGDDVAAVSSLDFGELGSATLRGELTWTADRPFARLQLFLDLDPAGANNQYWDGTISVPESGGAPSGTATFALYRQSQNPASRAWPERLRAVLSWTCGGWDAEPSRSWTGPTIRGDRNDWREPLKRPPLLDGPRGIEQT